MPRKLQQALSTLDSGQKSAARTDLGLGTPGAIRTLGDAAKSDLSEAAQQAALSALAASASPIWAFVGDSITNGSSATNSSYAYPAQSVARASGLIASPASYVLGVPGETTTAMLARINTALASANVRGLVILGGTNDAGQSVSLETYAQNMTAMIRAARARGMPVIVVTVPPQLVGATQSARRLVVAYNHWINTYARGLGAEIADAYTALVDPTTGYGVGALFADNVHPTDLGHSYIADQVVRAMQRIAARPLPFGLITAKHDAIITPDPLIVGGTVRPASWFEQPGGTGTAPTYSLVDNAGGFLPAGRWAQIDIDASDNTIRNLACTGTAAIGDKLVLCAHVEIDDVSGDWVENVAAGTAAARPLVINGGALVTQPFVRNPYVRGDDGVYRGIIAYAYTSTTTANAIWFGMTVPSGSHYTIRVGALGIVNATTLGAAWMY